MRRKKEEATTAAAVVVDELPAVDRKKLEAMVRELAKLEQHAEAGQPAAIYYPVSQLVPWDANPRENDPTVDEIARSIERFGWGRPLVVQASRKLIIAGNTAFKAAKKLRRGVVPVRFVNLPDGEAEAYALADNKISEISKWKDGALNQLLANMQKAGTKLEGLGFSGKELGKRLGRQEQTEQREFDEPKKPTNPKTRPGDLYALGEHRLICADSFEPDTFAKLLGDVKARAVVTDPPYAIYGSSTGVSADIADDNMVRPFFESIMKTAFSLCDFFAHIYICCDWRSFPAIWEAAKRAALAPKNLIVWDKGNSGLGSNYANGYELAAFFAKLPPMTAMKSTATRGQRQIHRSNVFRHNRVSGEERNHNAAKPVALFEEFVVNSTDEGDAVVDMFAGGGTLAIACEKQKRRAFMVEKDPGYCDVIVQRWEKFTGKAAVLFT